MHFELTLIFFSLNRLSKAKCFFHSSSQPHQQWSWFACVTTSQSKHFLWISLMDTCVKGIHKLQEHFVFHSCRSCHFKFELASHHHARLRAVSALQSGNWLHVLSISYCGLRVDDDAVEVVVGLLLGARHCVPSLCQGRYRRHTWVGRSVGRLNQHHTLNDLIWRALGRANTLAVKEPVSLVQVCDLRRHSHWHLG